MKMKGTHLASCQVYEPVGPDRNVKPFVGLTIWSAEPAKQKGKRFANRASGRMFACKACKAGKWLPGFLRS